MPISRGSRDALRASMSSLHSRLPVVDTTAHTQLRTQLWIEAYNCLEKGNALLVDAYERILSLRLHEHPTVTAAIVSSENVVKNMDPEERQEFFQNIIETVFERSPSAVSTTQPLNYLQWNPEFVKKIISSITLGGQKVAFVWVGVALALKFLLEPLTPDGFDREAVAFLVSRMNQYWDVSSLLLDENRSVQYRAADRNFIKTQVVKLYTSVLSWQMKSICAYYQRQANLFLQYPPPVSDWHELKNDLRQKEDEAVNRSSTTTAWRILYHFAASANSALSDEAKLRGLHSGKVLTICTACGNLDPSIWGAENYFTYVMDVQHASSECPACMALSKGFSAIIKPIDGSAQLTLTARKETSLKVHYHWGDHGVDGSRNIEFYIQQGAYKQFDYLMPWPVIGRGRSIRSSTRSGSIELVCEWFHRCLKEDLMCKVRKSTLPTRVLYVGNGSCEPNLYESCGEEAPYTALSHCWGDAEAIHLITTKANRNERMASISMEILPKTFSDAVVLTRALGIQYIWIDSLCIIQDDKDDWEREAAHMADVYQCAALTISADGAADGSKGLFQTVNVPLFDEISIPSRTPIGMSFINARETTLATREDLVHVVTHKESDPLQHRGWALQEWLLSDRIVHFSTGELLWECKAFQSCQCQVISQSPMDRDREDDHKLTKEDYYKQGKREGGGGYLDWGQVVHGYTRRQLTIQADRLPALSGLAMFAKLNAETDYIAGLWKSEMPEAILWKVDSDESERYEHYYAPSWSWAAVTGAVSYHEQKGSNELPLKCKVLELSTSAASHNPFGPLKSGFVKIQGPVGILSPEHMKRIGIGISLQDRQEGNIRYRGSVILDVKGLTFEVTSGDEIPFLIIKREMSYFDTIYGIALKKLPLEGGQFMRVGYVWISYYGKNWESWFLNDLKVTKQIVTIF
ncbi:heterokaryon incompatibility protein-domain-containing protein [Xylaria arbuscula]|nr:heterokaryon incompatibility protein-domain-containing protein [Xylaria arbuscula]